MSSLGSESLKRLQASEARLGLEGLFPRCLIHMAGEVRLAVSMKPVPLHVGLCCLSVLVVWRLASPRARDSRTKVGPKKKKAFLLASEFMFHHLHHVLSSCSPALI